MHASALIYLLITVFASQAVAYSVSRSISSMSGISGRTDSPHVRLVEPRATANVSTGTNQTVGNLCQHLGSGCKMQGGTPVLSGPHAPFPIHVLATSDDDPPDQPGDESNGGHEISKGHLDGSRNHTFYVRYGAVSIPVGVCNPQKMLQIVLDRACPIGDRSVYCTAKGNWPCDYVDDTAKGGWSPVDEGQRAVQKCTLGIDAVFYSNGDSQPTGMADFLKRLAVKAMEPPMQVQGGNVSLAPLPGRMGMSAPPNVTAWTVPAEMQVTNLYQDLDADPLGDGMRHPVGNIDVKIACPAEKSKSIDNCGLAGALVGLASALLAIFVPEAEAAVLGAVGAAGGVAGTLCSS